jgi:hypothetical protein
MKQFFLLLNLFLLVNINGNTQVKDYPILKEAQDQGIHYKKVKKANNFTDLVKALDHETVIILDTGMYTIVPSGGMENSPEEEGINRLSEYYNNGIISDLENLVILGTRDDMPFFMQPDQGKHVIEFKGMKNLCLHNLKFEHDYYHGCSGDVLAMKNCKNVLLDNLELRGSGFQGIYIEDSDSLTVKNSLVTDCSGQLASFIHTKNIMLQNCRFIENGNILRGFTVTDSEVMFKNSTIEEKHPYHDDPYRYNNLFNVLFLIDDDVESSYDEIPDLSTSRITFSNTIINGKNINNEYYNYSYPEDAAVIHFKELVLMLHDSWMHVGWENQNEKGVIPVDTANVSVEPGDSPEGKILEVLPSDKIKIKTIEQQFETSMGISFEGPHHDLVDWKHHTSKWVEVVQVADNQYQLREYTGEDYQRFPDFEKEELHGYLKTLGYEEPAKAISYSEESWGDKLFVTISRISLRVTAKDPDGKRVIKIIHFWMPMGC